MEICRVYFWTINRARPLHWSLARWRDISGRVTHEITARAPATPAEGYLVFCFFCFFAAPSNTRLRPGLKTSHESRAQKSYSGCLGSRCIRCEAPVAPRGGGCTLSRAGRNEVGARRRARAARKKKKKKQRPIETHHRFAMVRFFSDWSRLHLENRAEQGRDSAAEGEN